MDDAPPPPPPPHGEKPNTTHGEYRKASDLPEGNYDIFVIPPHSAGSGFLYLPSLQCQRNSFIAGSACTLVAVYMWMSLTPVVQMWYATTVASGGGTGIAILAIGFVGIGGWAFGNYQAGSGGASRQGPGSGPNWFGSGGPGASSANSSGGGGTNYARGGNFRGQTGGPHQQGNYGRNYAGGPPPGNQYSGNQYRANNEPPPQTGPNPNTNSGPPPGPKPGGADAKPTGSGPQKENKPHTAEDWEKAREETRRKEELRRKMEEFKRKREAEAREKERQREREQMEKELRERREQLEKEMAAAREAAEREAKLKAEKEAAEHRAKIEREAAEAKLKAEQEAANARKRDFEARVRTARAAAEAKAKARKEEAEAKARAEQAEAEAKAKAEKEEAEAKAKAEKAEAEAKAKAEKEAAEKEAAAKAAAKKEADAKFAALKEAAAKKYAEKKAKDAQEAAAKETASKVSSASAPPRTPSPKKPNVSPSKASAPMAEDDTYSFRPYDRPRRPYGASQSSVYSESSYAPSQSTARTTPPPSYSNRGPYETKDPDKIVIRGVYAFNQAFLRTPVAQLVSGQNMVTDGLVLRITTEGLFIDDDVRGVPQREWDVKAWTMKLVEVWCPQVGPPKPNAQKANQTFFRRSTNDAPSPEESDAYLANFLKVCKNTCRLASPNFSARNSADSKGSQPYGGLHVLRATIRDQEGRRYIFVLQETEGWKVALGLQRLRKGSQVRALGVCGMAFAETRTILSGLGY
ncbi:uncharacterized protein BDV17DRAFT_65154 [Aspergillus undulatus]|uniref:uncharacterized protein n=1 Tax=Aspergillus undulatus TaxID=1810928 RepID=UPI003CCD5954